MVNALAEANKQNLAGTNKFPQRLHLSVLALRLHVEQEIVVYNWARWAREQAAIWKSTRDPGVWDMVAAERELADEPTRRCPQISDLRLIGPRARNDLSPNTTSASLTFRRTLRCRPGSAVWCQSRRSGRPSRRGTPTALARDDGPSGQASTGRTPDLENYLVRTSEHNYVEYRVGRLIPSVARPGFTADAIQGVAGPGRGFPRSGRDRAAWRLWRWRDTERARRGRCAHLVVWASSTRSRAALSATRTVVRIV